MTNNKNQDQLNFKLNLNSIDEQGWFKGYASVFNILDQHQDIIAKGAFEKSIKNKKIEDIKLLWQHDPKMPIGTFTIIKEDEHGLYVEAKLLQNIQTGRDAYELLKSKAVSGLSIGFVAKKSEYNKKSGHRIITDLDLWEISLVTFPSNPMAQISDVKSDNQLLAPSSEQINHSSNSKAECNFLNPNKGNNMYDLTEVNNTESKAVKAYAVENVPSESKEHKAAFLGYLRKGVDNNLGVFEAKGLSSITDSEGGYLVTREVSNYINSTILSNSPFRKLASTETISSDALDILQEVSGASAGWTSDTATVAETDSPKIAKKRIDVHELYAQPKATQKLLDDSAINIEKWLSERVADTFSAKENDAFINGDGVGKPRGILSYDPSEIQQISSAKGQITADALFSLYYSLKEKYASKAVFLMHRSVIQAVRSIKDPKSGQFLWSSGIASGTPDTLLGVPVMQCSEMPMMQEGAVVIALADFNAAYKIVDRQGVRILRDPFTEKPFVKFYATKRVGGDVVNSEAIKLLKV